MKDEENLEFRLAQARQLVQHLEAGDTQQADALLHSMAEPDESALFQEIGQLTRQLHEAINGFLLDDRILAMVDHEIQDAAERLRYVISMTEQSANTTLAAVEAGMPMVEKLQRQSTHLAGQWQRFRDRELAVEDFRVLSGELSVFLAQSEADGSELHGKLTEVLMAQDFQDLTGQIIRKVIDLVQDVEDKLVQLIRLSGKHRGKSETPAQNAMEPSGPVVPGVDKGEVVSGQDEVDDLLSSLGF